MGGGEDESETSTENEMSQFCFRFQPGPYSQHRPDARTTPPSPSLPLPLAAPHRSDAGGLMNFIDGIVSTVETHILLIFTMSSGTRQEFARVAARCLR